MTEWRSRQVSELCSHIIDCVNKTAPISDTITPFKMLRTTNVRDGWIDTNHTRRVDETTYERWTRRMRPERGDVVLTREAPLGEVGMLRSDESVFLGQRLVMYRADPAECDSHFLLYSMLGPSVQAELRRLGSGATVEHLRVPDCEKLTIRCPELPIQRRIGAVLSALDDLIENNRRRVEVLEELARTIYREWFVYFRYPGHETVLLADSVIGPIPAQWSVESVADLSSVVTRGIAPKYAEDGSWVVINQRCIREERVTMSAARRQQRDVPATKRVRFGDVLINSTGVGTLGRVAFYRGDVKNLTVDSHVSIARPREDLLNPWYGLTLLSKSAELEQLGVGSTGQTELSRADIGALKVVVPSIDVRTQFADRAWPLLSHADELLQLNLSLANIRNLMLPKLINGEIDLSSLDLDAVVQESVV